MAARVTVALDAHLAIEIMLLTATSTPQAAVEAAVRDYLERARRDPLGGRHPGAAPPDEPPQG